MADCQSKNGTLITFETQSEFTATVDDIGAAATGTFWVFSKLLKFLIRKKNSSLTFFKIGLNYNDASGSTPYKWGIRDLKLELNLSIYYILYIHMFPFKTFVKF